MSPMINNPERADNPPPMTFSCQAALVEKYGPDCLKKGQNVGVPPSDPNIEEVKDRKPSPSQF